MIYLSSDVFTDQFGGEKGQKFFKARFHDLLIKMSTLEIAEQKKLISETFGAWKGSHEQIDDVCVAGIRIL